MFPPRRTIVGFAPSSRAAASGSASRTKKLLLSDELLDPSPPLLFVPEEETDFSAEGDASAFFPEGTSVSLPEVGAPRGRDERRGGVDHDVDLLDVALVFALQGGAELKVQAGMDCPQWYRHLWNA